MHRAVELWGKKIKFVQAVNIYFTYCSILEEKPCNFFSFFQILKNARPPRVKFLPSILVNWHLELNIFEDFDIECCRVDRVVFSVKQFKKNLAWLRRFRALCLFLSFLCDNKSVMLVTQIYIIGGNNYLSTFMVIFLSIFFYRSLQLRADVDVASQK